MTETNGTWGDAQAALGSGPSNVEAGVGGLSCAAVSSCSMGGGYSNNSGQSFQAVVQDETPVVATSNVVQVKNRATGKCLNEDQNTGLLSTYTCLPGTYVSLRWKVVTYSDGTRDLVSVQTGQAVRDGAVNQQLSLTSASSPMRFQNGGIFRFPNDLVMGVNRQGNFVPVIGSPSFSNLDNVRWDFGSVAA